MDIHWDKPVATSRLAGSLQMGPGSGFGDWKRPQDKPFYAEQMAALRALKPAMVRYSGWHNRPDLVIAEPEPPSDGATSWDFSAIDPPFLEFLDAIGGRPFVMNFSTPPAWAKTDAQIADYYGRFVRWYSQGGFTDETGEAHESRHRIAFPYWEVLNEPDFEGALSPAEYTARYDAIVDVVHQVSPETRFVGLALAFATSDPAYTTHFLNPRNHKPGVPVDYVSYHFYALYRPDQSPAEQAAAVFDQADQFVDILRYVAAIRDELSPHTGIMTTELGAMNQGARGPRTTLGFEAQLSSAMYAYLYARMAALGVEAAHVSGLAATQPDQMWQELAMIDWASGKPNARYWTLKLLNAHFGPGAKLVETRAVKPPPYPLPPTLLATLQKRAPVFPQAFVAADGAKKLLLVNRSAATAEVEIPAGTGAKLEIVDQASGVQPARAASTADGKFTLDGLAVAVATLA